MTRAAPVPAGTFLYRHPWVAWVLLVLTAAATGRTEPAPPADSSSSGYRFALVLSGGGSRGLAQVGVLKAFEEEGLRPDLVVGTSMGAIIAGLYASGYTSAEIEGFTHSVDWTRIFSNSASRTRMLVSQKNEPVDFLLELRFDRNLRPMLPSSISHGQQFYNYIAGLLAPAQYRARGNYDSLAVPLRVLATNILDGRGVVIAHGNMARALRASSGVPLAFSPVGLDSMVLMDGGLVSNIPVQIALDAGCTHVLAVDVTSPLHGPEALDNPVDLMEQVIGIGIESRKAAEEEASTWLLRPDLEGIDNTDFTQLDTLIARGYRAARQVIPGVAESLARLAPSPTYRTVDTLSRRLVWEGIDSGTVRLLATVLDSLRAQESRPLTRPLLDSALGAVLRTTGRPFTRIAALSSTDSATVVAVDPGVVSAVRVTGNHRCVGSMIRRGSNIRVGDTLTSQTLPEAITALYATGLFYTVNADMDSSGTVHLYVQEKPYLRIRGGLRFDEFLLGEGYVEPAYENLFGLGISCALRLQYGLRREKYAIDLYGNQLISPWWANSLRMQGYIAREAIIEREELPDTTDTTGTRFFVDYSEQSLRKAGLIFLLGTEIGKLAMLSGGVRMERFETFGTESGVLTSGLGPFTRMVYWFGHLTVDNLDRSPFPTRGHQHTIRLGGAHDRLSETESFFKVDGSFSYCLTLGERHTISPAIAVGWANHSVPVVEKFYLGGLIPEEQFRMAGMYNYISFVGLRPRALTGDLLAAVNLSYRARVVGKLYITAALDWGYVWQEPEFRWNGGYLRESLESAPLGLGIGVAYDSRVGPVRFTWGRLLRDAAPVGEPIPSVERENLFYFSVGHDF